MMIMNKGNKTNPKQTQNKPALNDLLYIKIYV